MAGKPRNDGRMTVAVSQSFKPVNTAKSCRSAVITLEKTAPRGGIGYSDSRCSGLLDLKIVVVA